MNRGALLSPDGIYRYALWRDWGHGAHMTFIMLNPSTADASVDDPTIRRCMGFARREMCAGIKVVNLFAYRATNPKELLSAEDPSGIANPAEISLAIHEATEHGWPLVCAWGANPHVRKSTAWNTIMKWRENLLCLGKTKNGDPRHPLYLKNEAPLIPW